MKLKEPIATLKKNEESFSALKGKSGAKKKCAKGAKCPKKTSEKKSSGKKMKLN